METKKRIYVGLLAASLLFEMALAAMIWYVIVNRDIIISQIMLIIVAAVLGIIFLILGIGILATVIMIIRSKNMPSMEKITLWANELLFPIAMVIGRLMGLEKEKILKSFISVNNYIVASKRILPGDKILMLLPHCLQNSDCPFKITIDINNCKNCGKCPIGQLKELGLKYNAVLKVATGGTLARKWIEEVRPRAVIAVACERDLAAGIQDTGGLPVMGVLNSRPYGPCVNTDVCLEQVDQAFRTIVKGVK
ncbi:hypothetical protein ASZ90_018819 [hydrocarbon metagenome]|uniref:DUF116 domain-containing protein n=1 Tax=hydrocarbon metagenome TaxID=938273 RepID=A0A0W8E542_9ZZZZ